MTIKKLGDKIRVAQERNNWSFNLTLICIGIGMALTDVVAKLYARTRIDIVKTAG
jgi:hypothetical protein